MLSRSAQGLYWMGRYFERVGYLCRLMKLQVEALVDRPVAEIHFGWRRIYGSVYRSPPVGGDFDSDEGDEFALADSFTLAGDLTFERTNPDSIRSSFSRGRENAREIRHCISAEMWSCLNLAWLRIHDLEIEDIWRVSPERFYMETARDIDTLTGVSEATMYRGEGWRFLQMGRCIERAQLMVALLAGQTAASRAQGGTTESNWTSLLRACQALDAYNRSYSVDIQPAKVIDLLVTDPLLPGALCRSFDMLEAVLSDIGPGLGPRDAAARLAGRLRTLVRHEWPDEEDKTGLLTQAETHCRTLHELVVGSYMEYTFEDPRGR